MNEEVRKGYYVLGDTDVTVSSSSYLYTGVVEAGRRRVCPQRPTDHTPSVLIVRREDTLLVRNREDTPIGKRKRKTESVEVPGRGGDPPGTATESTRRTTSRDKSQYDWGRREGSSESVDGTISSQKINTTLARGGSDVERVIRVFCSYDLKVNKRPFNPSS